MKSWKNIFLTYFLLASMASCAVLLSACHSQNTTWHLEQATDNQHFTIKLDCTTQPAYGPFQDCSIQLNTNNGSPVTNAKIFIDGGMPAHGHGLPTNPIAKTTQKDGLYKIEGLQYSMPGKWVLGFVIEKDSISDRTVFHFEID